ncbi:MAG: hypothetical protein Q8K58_10800 [Acidimicrobiales bacterium]|nr:hypothetical protein [Acidimicrobiales bacterium]
MTGHPAGSQEAAAELRSIVSQHVGILVSASLATAAAIRLFRIAHGDVTTALAVLQRSDTSTVLVGLLVDLVPVVTPAIGLTLLLAIPPSESASAWKKVGGYGVLGLLIFSLVPLNLLLIAVGLTGAFAVIPAVRRWLFRDHSLSGVGAVGGIALVLVVVVPDDPWLPAEIVRIDSAETAAYVLDDEGTVSVLRDRDRKVIFLPSSSLDDRRLCSATGSEWPSLLTLVAGFERSADYPDCPRRNTATKPP